MNPRLITDILTGCLIILLIVFYNLYEQRTQQYNDAASYYHSSLHDTVSYYINKQGHHVAEKKANLMDGKVFADLKRENEHLKQKVQGFKNIQSITEITTDNRMDSIAVLLHDTVPCFFSPVPFAVDSPFFSLSGKISNASVFFDSIAFINKQTIVVGEKRTGLLKKRDWVVSVENTNPYLHVMGLNTITLRSEKHWYQSGWIKFAAGVATGIVLVK